MTVPSLQVTDAPSAADLEQIGSSLAAYNDGSVGPSARRPLAVLVRVEDHLVAGLSGYTAWGWLYTQWLWVGEGQRGNGLAAKMLNAAEAEAIGRGCLGAYIDTFNPQALKVYQKAGYAVFGELADFPKGRTRNFLSKQLN